MISLIEGAAIEGTVPVELGPVSCKKMKVTSRVCFFFSVPCSNHRVVGHSEPVSLVRLE